MSAFPECQWQPPFTKGKPCEKCGRPLPRDYDKPPRADCPVEGYGDLLAKALYSFGLTIPRYLRVKSWLIESVTGKSVPVGCGCKHRKERLNRLGIRL